MGSVLSEEFSVGQGLVVEGALVVQRIVEVLTVRRVHKVVVLRLLCLKVINPTELAIDVSFLNHL